MKTIRVNLPIFSMTIMVEVNDDGSIPPPYRPATDKADWDSQLKWMAYDQMPKHIRALYRAQMNAHMEQVDAAAKESARRKSNNKETVQRGQQPGTFKGRQFKVKPRWQSMAHHTIGTTSTS